MTPEQQAIREEKRRISRRAYEERNPKWVWAKYAVKDARKRAAKKNVPFSLTTKHVMELMVERCPIFDTVFQYGGNGKILPTSPSLDRIVPSLGYVEGNVVIISSKANNIKSAYGSKELYKVADWLYELEKGFK